MTSQGADELDLDPKDAATRTGWHAKTLVAWARSGLIAARRVLNGKRTRARWRIRVRRATTLTGWDVVEL